MFGQLYKLEVILANIAYFIIVSDCFFFVNREFEWRSSSGGVRAEEFERRSSSGGVFNAVYAAFRRSVSRRFERGSSSGGTSGDSKSYGQDLILNTPNGGTYGFTYLIR